ncbi:uncharacterized protein A1O5_07721 [Cladophialophora psammophila CBS 110553]|uniref:Uncharacterized protein n=1 Tax=Cladophialophora psammophila CBS 110553 TaxID=1182543 RepID=W9WUR0_9EURO|nr:uncharacterized protein A1O5_07721 [Cladophialophora psammophila CBS 110553]EXJ68790.1 hypothetical protein A1O5_07721 [Cladophialophora psammophila CBS 110553]
MEPKPNIAILGAAGLANLDGRPFTGSAAQFLRNEVQWLNEPRKVIWCLHDESAIKPYRVDTQAATDLVHSETKSRVWMLKPGTLYQLFD